jgi:hypothetical protein
MSGPAPSGYGGRGLGVDLAPALRLLGDDDVGVRGVELVDQGLDALHAVGRLLHVPQRDLDGVLGEGRRGEASSSGRGAS